LLLRLGSFQSCLPCAASLLRFPEASFTPLGRTKSLALTLPAPHGLQGLQALAAHGLQGLQGLQALAAHGLHGLQAFFAAHGLQGLQGLQAFFTAQGLQGLQGLQAFLVAQGLQGLHAVATIRPRLAAQGLAVLAAIATSVGVETVTRPPTMAAHKGLRLKQLGIDNILIVFSVGGFATLSASSSTANSAQPR
jgi:hypothetical protein